ncbi:hypothetical protein BGX26_003971, partial [Mortierella sp. AD094]
MTLSSRPKSDPDPDMESKSYAAKEGKSLIQRGDKLRADGELKRAAKCYNMAKTSLPLEAQNRLNLLPKWSLSSETKFSIHPVGNGQNRAILKEKATKMFKRSSHKPTLAGPYFPKGTHPSPPPLMSQNTLTQQGTVCTFNEAKDTNSVITTYIAADPETKSILRNRINDIIIQSDKSFISLEVVQELVILANIPDRAVFLHVITQMLKVLKEKPLLASIVVQGMAVAINSFPKEINMDDMQGTYLEILKSIKGHLEAVRIEKNEYQFVPLLTSLTALLNAMVCEKVSGLDREYIFNPLIDLLDGLKSHDDTTVAFSALVATQALARIGNDESLAVSVFRRAKLAIAMAGDIAGVISSADISGLQSAYDNFIAMCDFSVKYEWYLGLAYVDGILEHQSWSAFETFVLHSKFKSDLCFLQGVCLRLEQIAATQRNGIRHGAIEFLQALATSSAEMVQNTAQAALKRLDVVGRAGSHSKDATQHLLRTSSDRLVSQDRGDDLPPVWDPIWHATSGSKLLKAVQQRERAKSNLDEMPGRLDDIKQSITSSSSEVKTSVESGFAQTSSELKSVNTNLDKMMGNMSAPAKIEAVHDALLSFYNPLLRIKRVSGKELELESCYINLAVVEAPGQREKDKQDLETQKVIFQRMPSHERTEGTNLTKSIPLEEIFNKQRLRDGKEDAPKTILIHGRAGIGKTTLCKKLVQLTLNRQWRDRFDTVLWLPLRDLKFYKPQGLEDLFMRKYFSRHSSLDRTGLAQALFTQATNDEVLFILDGLDELQTDDDPALKDLLSQLLGQKHIVITSRPSGVDKSILPTIDLELETVGFSSQNVKDYLQKVVPELAKPIEEFIQRTPVIQGLVNIPVQLDAICFSWDSLPSDISEITMTGLYQAMVRKLWCKDAIRLGKTTSGRIIPSSEIQRLSPRKIDELMNIEIEYLGYLAFKGLEDDHRIVFDEETLNNAMDDLDDNRDKKNKDRLPSLLLHDLKQTSFLHSADADLNPDSGNLQGSWFFLHLTFQEYFAATWIARHLQNKQGPRSPMLMMTLEETKEFVLKYKYNPRYEIVWWMVAGLLEGDALKGFFDIIQGRPRDILGGRHQQLLASCLKEARSQLDPTMVERLEGELMQWLHFELALLNDNNNFCMLGGHSAFPEEILVRSLGPKNLKRKQIISTLGKHSNLTLHAVQELFKTLQDKDWHVRDSAARALGAQLTSSESIIQALIGALQHEDKNVRYSATKALSAKSTLSESTIQALIGALQDKSWDVRHSAAMALDAQLTLPESAIQAFIGVLQNEKRDPSFSLSYALVAKSTLPESAIQALIGALQHEHMHVRRYAAKALHAQSILSESAVQAIIGTFQHEDRNVRYSAAEALHAQLTLSESAVQALIGALQHEDWNIGASAARALGGRSTLSESAIQALIGALQDEHSGVRVSAAEALGGKSTLSESAIQALIGALQDKD